MKRVLFVLLLCVALTFGFAATAFADHSPSFFIKWDPMGGYEGANVGGAPHAGYVEGSQKCGVCHAVHRAPVAGTGWVNHAANAVYGTPANPDPTQPDGMLPHPAEAGGENRATRQIYLVPEGTNTQMLLQSDVSGACDYCHVKTAIGGRQLYAGDPKYHVEANSAEGGSDWEGGFAHNNSCTACHAVHGAYNPGAGFDGTGNKVFQGPIGNKVLKAYAKTTNTTWQQAVVVAGANVTDMELEGMFVDPSAVTRDSTSNATVSPKNIPLFASKDDALAGTNVRNGTDIGDAQVTAFCTFCHENYGYASEDLINPQNVNVTAASVVAQRALADESRVVGKGLFQGPWVYRSPANGTLYSVRGSASSTSVPGLDGQIPVKNHPMKTAEAALVAGGATFTGRVAFKSSNTCRDCHDAGVEGGIGVIIQSWPHFTPGYFKFLKTADHAGGAMTDIDPRLAATIIVAPGDTAGLAAIRSVLDSPTVIEEAQATADGACLKCHVNSSRTSGVSISF